VGALGISEQRGKPKNFKKHLPPKSTAKERIPPMRKSLLILFAAAATSLAPMGLAQKSEAHNPLPRHFPTNRRFVVEFAGGGSGGSLVYHGGPVLVTAYVVPIYWGPSWGTNGSDNQISSSLTNFIDGIGTSSEPGFGLTGEYNVIT